jgi:hypothetical protein
MLEAHRVVIPLRVVVIVSTWKLLTLVMNDQIFSDASLGWVNAIVLAIAAGWVVLVGALLYVGFNADTPDYHSCCS